MITLREFMRKEFIIFKDKFPKNNLVFYVKHTDIDIHLIKVNTNSILEKEKYCKEEFLLWDKLEKNCLGERFLFLGKGKKIIRPDWTFLFEKKFFITISGDLNKKDQI